MRLLSLMSLLIFAANPVFSAEEMISKGEGFDKEGKTKLWTYERFQEVRGSRTLGRTVYKDTEGKILVEEKIIEENGKLVRYDIDQKQLRQKAWIEVADGKATFNLKKFRKRNYPQTVALPDRFIVGLQIVQMVQENWDMFLNGQELKFKLGVWHRQEAISFKLSRESQTDSELVVKMNPTSMFIRAVVDPLFFIFDKKTKNLTSYKGRLTPKEKRGQSYYDQDGMVTYQSMGSGKKATKPAPKKVLKGKAKPKAKAKPEAKKDKK